MYKFLAMCEDDSPGPAQEPTPNARAWQTTSSAPRWREAVRKIQLLESLKTGR
jgi:hypothetical protein